MTRWEMVLHVENTWLKVKTSSGFVDFSLFVVCLFMYFDGFIKLFKILSPHTYFAYYKACVYRRRWAIINLNVAVVNFTSSMFSQCFFYKFAVFFYNSQTHLNNKYRLHLNSFRMNLCSPVSIEIFMKIDQHYTWQIVKKVYV